MNDMSAEFGGAPPLPSAGRADHGSLELKVNLRRRLITWIERARYSIVARINLAASGLATLLLILGVVVIVAAAHLGTRTEQAGALREAALTSAELTASIGETRYRASRYSAKGERAEIERAREALTGAKKKLAAASQSSAPVDPAALEAMQWLQVQVEGFDQELSALQSSIEAYGPSASGTSLAAALDISGEQLAAQADRIKSDLLRASAGADADFRVTSRRTAMMAAALLVGCVLLTALGARFGSRTTAAPVTELTRAMTELAGGDRDVHIPGTERHDEIGKMAQALAVFRARSDELARLQREAAAAAQAELERQGHERARHTAAMHELARHFERTVGEIVRSVAAASEQLQLTAAAMTSAAAH